MKKLISALWGGVLAIALSGCANNFAVAASTGNPSSTVPNQVKKGKIFAMNNVKNFGARGDGITNDTAAIQRAIDAGGLVYFPAGTYVTGTIYLKSNGGIHLESGAVLRASHDLKDYNADNYCPQNSLTSREFVSCKHLITAVEQENITLSGTGCIDGDALHWMTEKESWHLKRNPQRPAQMIYLVECRNVKVRDLFLKNASYWHLFIHGCENVSVQGIQVEGHPQVMNNDGIDIDSCQNVTIADCLIDTADDCIAIRADSARLKQPRPCESVTVTNCVLRTNYACAIRVGVGSGWIRNVLVNNIVIRKGSRTGICIMSKYTKKSSGVNMENLRFNQIQMDVYHAFNIRLSNVWGNPPFEGMVQQKNLSFRNIYGQAVGSSFLLGNPGGDLSNVEFNNVQLDYCGPGVAPDTDAQGRWGRASKDCAFYLENAQNITFDRLKINWRGDHSGWKHDIECVNSEVAVQNSVLTKGIARKTQP